MKCRDLVAVCLFVAAAYSPAQGTVFNVITAVELQAALTTVSGNSEENIIPGDAVNNDVTLRWLTVRKGFDLILGGGCGILSVRSKMEIRYCAISGNEGALMGGGKWL